jgi:hypothetical protein
MSERVSVTPEEAGPIRRWIVNHDDSRLFIVLYIGLAVVLSIVISLFWLVAIVGAHFALEWIRQRTLQSDGFWGVLSRVLWELKLDIALILFALMLALYMELTMGVVGIGAVARSGALTGSRFLVIQRVLRGILLSLDDLAQVLRVVMRRKRSAAVVEAQTEDVEIVSGWRGPWTTGDYLTVGFGGACLVAILCAPLLDHYTVETVVETLLSELHPLPFLNEVD